MFSILKKETRIEEKKMKKEKKIICHNCKEMGHTKDKCNRFGPIKRCFKVIFNCPLYYN